MKKALTLVLCAALCLGLTAGCSLKRAIRGALQLDGKPVPAGTGSVLTERPAQTASLTQKPADTPDPSQEPTPEPAPEPEPTQAPASTRVPPGLSGNRIDLTDNELAEYFKTIVFSNDGTVGVVKWVDPITVSVSGPCPDADSERLQTIFNVLNEFEGFPGFAYAETADAKLQVHFVTDKQLAAAEPGWNGEYSCYVTYEYDGYKLKSADVYLVSEWVTDQQERDFLLTWAVFFSSGCFNRADTYYDSVFISSYPPGGFDGGFFMPVVADWYVFGTLYDERVKPGMTMAQALAALAD